jgi:ubiquitin carboxyl-terminal hydrolase 36/42
MKLYSFYNLGNTCYLNSVLVCFVSNKAFIESIESNDSELAVLLKKIQVDFTDNEEYTNHKCNPSKIHFLFRDKFRIFLQHDAHEFLLEFMDILKLKDYTGKQKTDITCERCTHNIEKYEEFLTIDLNIHGNLTESFMEYLKRESIHYCCEKCGSDNTTKKISIHTLPKFLIVVIKRYSPTGQKINEKVIFSTQLVINEVNYNLYAVIYHHGNSERGHYNCSVKVNNRWYFIDDDMIKVSEEVFDYTAGYILFYQRNQ